MKYGHIITHLFMDGGRILKSVKTSYSEYIGGDRMADIVREMMKQQHKAMFIALRDGKFDAVVDGDVVPAAPADARPPKRRPARGRRGGRPRRSPQRAGRADRARAPDAANVAARAPGFADAPDGPATIRTQMPEELMLDIDALERAAAAAAAGDSPLLRGASDLPPPPANLFRERKTTGKYKVTPRRPPPPSTPAGARRPARGAPVRRTSQLRRVAGGLAGVAWRDTPRSPLRADAAGVDLRPGQAPAGQDDLRRGPDQRQVPGRGHPELPRRGPGREEVARAGRCAS